MEYLPRKGLQIPGLQKFAETRFADTIKLLVEHGVSPGHVAGLLLKYDRWVYDTAYG